MTHATKRIGGPVLVGAAALALAGCSATHVGESWQCPLAQGASCASIADADPAVPEAAPEATPAGAQEPALAVRTPLYRIPERRRSETTGDATRSDGPCETGCGPFAWVVRWLGLERGDANGGPGAESPAGTVAAVAPSGPPASPAPGEAAAGAAGLPLAVPGAGADAGLRAPEVIGRIWIAPFVDANGVYREGSYVRAVLEPALWRRP